jgi:hypothetical protein
VAASAVAIGGLGWAIISYFLPKPPQDDALKAHTGQNVKVDVPGSGSVGVGVMNSGQINVVSPVPTQTSGSSKGNSSPRP